MINPIIEILVKKQFGGKMKNIIIKMMLFTSLLTIINPINAMRRNPVEDLIDEANRAGRDIGEHIQRQGDLLDKKHEKTDAQIEKLTEKLANTTDPKMAEQISRAIEGLRAEKVDARNFYNQQIAGARTVENAAAGFVSGIAGAYQSAISNALTADQKQMDAYNRRKEVEAQEKAKWAGIQKLLSDPKTLTRVSGAVVAGAAGISLTYYLAKLGFNYFDEMIRKPTLIKETSIRSPMDQFLDVVLGRKPEKSRFAEIVLEPRIDFQLKEIADTLETNIENGEAVFHVLLTGPAGTGKTMFAKALAMRLSQKNLRYKGKKVPVNYISCAGSDFAQFKNGEDLVEINKIVKYGTNAEGITILFVDEIDSLLEDRGNSKATLESKNRTNLMLSIFDKPTWDKKPNVPGQIMLIGATNFHLDKAAFSRFSKKVHFLLPTGTTLVKLYDQYMAKEVFSKGISTDQTFKDKKSELIDSLKGLSPRTIEDIAKQTYTRARYLKKTALTYEIAKSVIEEQKEAEKRNDDKEGNNYLNDTSNLNTNVTAAV